MLPEFWRAFDPATLGIMCKAFERAMRGVSDRPALQQLDAYSVRHLLARRIIEAAQEGERDPDRLLEAALDDLTQRAW